MTGYYAIQAWDRPKAATARETAKAAHFAYIDTVLGQIAVAGPLRNVGGDNIGSLLIVKAASADEAEQLPRADPYWAAGVWAEWRIDKFLPAAGEWIGGKLW